MKVKGTLEQNVVLPIGIKTDNGLVKEVTIREMTGLDREAMSAPRVMKSASKQIGVILSRCIVSSPAGEITEDKVAEMYMADRSFLLYEIRKISLGNMAEAGWECESCKHQWLDDFDLEDIPVTMADASTFNPVTEFTFPKPAFFNDREYFGGKLTIANGKVEEAVTSLTSTNGAVIESKMLEVCLLEVDGEPTPKGFVNSLTLRNRKFLMDLQNTHKFGMDLDMNKICPKCGHEFMQALNIQDFLA